MILDEDGLPRILNSHSNAIINYVVWHYAERLAKNTYVIYGARDRWRKYCDEVRASEVAPDRTQMKYLGALWNKSLPQYFINW
jgi:hypothetical protein